MSEEPKLTRSSKILLLVIGIPTLMALSFIGGAVAFSKLNQNLPSGIVAAQDGDLAKISEAKESLEHTFVEPVTEDTLTDGAIRGMVESVDDQFTRYLTKKEFSDLQRVTAGIYQGIGITIAPTDGKIVVSTVYKGTPAAKAGLIPGDQIAKIGDRATKSMNVETAVNLIRGKPGTKVRLQLLRPGKGTYERTIVRQKIRIPNVTSRLDAGSVGYVMLTQFNKTSAVDLRGEIRQLRKRGAKGIVLDLRGNPGGLLDQAIDVTSIFVPKGTVVSTKDRTGRKLEYKVKGDAIASLPIVVLINRGSASASEIVAGALQDHHRAAVIGARSFGKASVQQVVPLSDGSGMIITTAHYFTPSGRNIAKKGITPDIEVKLTGDKSRGADPESPHVPQDPAEDNQLKKAEEVLRDMIRGYR